MSHTKRRHWSTRPMYTKKISVHKTYCQSIPGQIVADHGEYRRDICMSDGGFIDRRDVRRRMKQAAHKVIRQDGKRVVADQLTEVYFDNLKSAQ